MIKFIQLYVSSKPYLFFDIHISVMIVCMLNILRMPHSSLSLYLIPSPRSRTHILCSIKFLEQHILCLCGILKKISENVGGIFMAVNYPKNHVEMTWSDIVLFPLNKGEKWCMELSLLAEIRKVMSPPHGRSGLQWFGFLGVRYGFYFFFLTEDM